MAQAGNNQDRFGGEFMVQDSDHMSGIKSSSNGTRQADQSQSHGRQQGSNDEHVSGQQGGERHRKSR